MYGVRCCNKFVICSLIFLFLIKIRFPKRVSISEISTMFFFFNIFFFFYLQSAGECRGWGAVWRTPRQQQCWGCPLTAGWWRPDGAAWTRGCSSAHQTNKWTYIYYLQGIYFSIFLILFFDLFDLIFWSFQSHFLIFSIFIFPSLFFDLFGLIFRSFRSYFSIFSILFFDLIFWSLFFDLIFRSLFFDLIFRSLFFYLFGLIFQSFLSYFSIFIFWSFLSYFSTFSIFIFRSFRSYFSIFSILFFDLFYLIFRSLETEK